MAFYNFNNYGRIIKEVPYYHVKFVVNTHPEA